jgi:two-component system, NtrC family, sensor kinase
LNRGGKGAVLVVKRFKLGIAAKLGLCLVAGSAVIFTAFGYWNLRLQRRGAEELVLQSADRISDLIKRSTRYQMLENDREGLYQTIRDIGHEPGIDRIRIFNKDGRIMFSTDLAEVNTMVDKHAEACYACHAQAAPLAKLGRPDRARTFMNAGGRRILALMRPIENEASCSGAACHAHPSGQQILGVIDAQLKLDVVDAQASRQQTLLARFTIVGVALLCLTSVAFVWAVLYRPIQDLMKGTHRVADGDLNYRLPVRSRDEIAELAESFNKMTTELAEARARLLEQTQKALAGSEQMASLGKLAATVAHEVNNPLFGILTYAKLCHKAIAESGIGEEVRKPLIEQLEVIERESRRCGEIMRNLLTFARQSPRRRERNDLNELITRAVLLMKHQCEIRGIQIETRLAPELEKLECDAGQIQQIVLVLLMNATEAMPQGGSLQVATERVFGEQSMRLRVRDSGPGIAADVMPHVFEPFFTTKEEQQSTGLGLAVAKSIIDQHGGSIQVHSKKGEGAEFVITLPVEQAVATSEPAAIYG